MRTTRARTTFTVMTAVIAAAAGAVLTFPSGAIAQPPHDSDDPGHSNPLPGPSVPTYPDITAEASIVVNRYNGAVLGGVNADRLMAPASTTKMMVGLLAVEGIEEGWLPENATVTTQSDVAVEGGGAIGLVPGDTISVRDLLYLSLVASQNDAATALGTYIGGSRSSFIGAMDQRAAELGLRNTSYVVISGRDPGDIITSCEEAPGRDTETDFNLPWCAHHTTARDLATLARIALDHPLFAQVVSTQTWSTTTWRRPRANGTGVRAVDVANQGSTNQLLCNFPGAYGVKTGTSFLAGEALVSAARRSGATDTIAVVLNSDTNRRFNDSRELLNFGLNYYH
ncbi:D-alanyl-D-alanine carboxypeptidase family protein [Nakamurella sp. GG22]